MPVQVSLHRPLFSEFILGIGGQFDSGPIGYGDCW